MAFIARMQVLTSAAAQPPEAIALAVLLEREQIVLLRIGLQVVEIGNGAGGISECGMACYVTDPLGADVNGAPVSHAFQLFCSTDQHRSSREAYAAWYNVNRPPRKRLESSAVSDANVD